MPSDFVFWYIRLLLDYFMMSSAFLAISYVDFVILSFIPFHEVNLGELVSLSTVLRRDKILEEYYCSRWFQSLYLYEPYVWYAYTYDIREETDEAILFIGIGFMRFSTRWRRGELEWFSHALDSEKKNGQKGVDGGLGSTRFARRRVKGDHGSIRLKGVGRVCLKKVWVRIFGLIWKEKGMKMVKWGKFSYFWIEGMAKGLQF